MYGLCDFPGIDAGDLSFKKDEILIIIKKPDEQWWSTWNKDSQVGMIPVPFIKRLARRVTHIAL